MKKSISFYSYLWENFEGFEFMYVKFTSFLAKI